VKEWRIPSPLFISKNIKKREDIYG
jgi:hypothetical protein